MNKITTFPFNQTQNNQTQHDTFRSHVAATAAFLGTMIIIGFTCMPVLAQNARIPGFWPVLQNGPVYLGTTGLVGSQDLLFLDEQIVNGTDWSATLRLEAGAGALYPTNWPQAQLSLEPVNPPYHSVLSTHGDFILKQNLL